MQFPEAADARRILILTPSLDYGGAEIVILQLARFLADQGWRVSIVSMLPPRAFVATAQGFGATVISLDMKRGSLNLKGIIALLGYVKRFRPDLIHAHMFHANVLARLLSPFTHAPVICTVQSTMEAARTRSSAPLRDWAYRLTNWGCSRTTTVAEAATARFVAAKLLPSDRVETIPNGVDVEQFRPDSGDRLLTRADLNWEGDFVWLAVGRLELAKDYPTLLEAFAQVSQMEPAARLAIVGEGRLRSELEMRVRALGLTTCVQFLGLRTDIVQLLNACDAFVLSSAWEGGPIVVLEAGATGKAVVSTLVGAAPQMVLPGRTGYLTPVRDASALASEMIKLMSLLPDEREAMGIAARSHIIEHFSVESIHQRYLSLFNAVLAEQG